MKRKQKHIKPVFVAFLENGKKNILYYQNCFLDVTYLCHSGDLRLNLQSTFSSSEQEKSDSRLQDVLKTGNASLLSNF